MMPRKFNDFNPSPQQRHNHNELPRQPYTEENNNGTLNASGYGPDNQEANYFELQNRASIIKLHRRSTGLSNRSQLFEDPSAYDSTQRRESYNMPSGSQFLSPQNLGNQEIYDTTLSGDSFNRPPGSQFIRPGSVRYQNMTQDENPYNRPPEEQFFSSHQSLSRTTKEERINSLEEIMELTTTLAHKIAYKKDLENRHIKYQVMKKKNENTIKHYLNKLQTSYKNNMLWKGGLRIVDYKYGAGVYSYFRFIQWLVYLNLFIFILTLSFIILPTAIENLKNPIDCDTSYPASVECCAVEYFNQTSTTNVISDLFQGTGILEKTVAFIGRYTTDIIRYHIYNSVLYYDVPAAYIIVTIVYLLVSLLAIFIALTSDLRTRHSNLELPYSNLIFPAWDFTLDKSDYAERKHKMIYTEITTTMNIELIENERKKRFSDNKGKIITIRIFANLLVLAILIGSAVGIIFVFIYSTDELENFVNDSFIESIAQFGLEFLPSIVIVLLNMVVPFFLQRLVVYEQYSTSYAIRFTIIRMVILRLFSLFILYYTFYLIIPEKTDSDKCSNTNVLCWETFIGQQAYKLALTDFGTQIVMTFVVNFARSRIGKLDNKFAILFGRQMFDLPKNVLDIVYMQTVCWFGSFYSPILPAMFTVILFAMFYIKRFACLVNCTPSTINTYRTRSNSMFMQVLLFCFAVALFPVAMSLGAFSPSKSCGPFRNLDNMWVVISNGVATLDPLDDIISYVSMLVIPILVLLILTLYYYVAIIATNKGRVREAIKELKYWNTVEKPYLINYYKTL